MSEPCVQVDNSNCSDTRHDAAWQCNAQSLLPSFHHACLPVRIREAVSRMHTTNRMGVVKQKTELTCQEYQQAVPPPVVQNPRGAFLPL